MELTGRRIREAARAYPRQDRVDFEEEERQLDVLPIAFAEGTWTWEDLEWVVGWKSNRVIPDFRMNDTELAEDTVRRTLERQSVVEKVETLQNNLHGVGVPVASALLLFMDPIAYTVLDERAWSALQVAGHLDTELSETPTVDEYLMYLGVCHTLANEIDVELRTLDRGLWVLSKNFD
ncbi:hypothetical protein [Natrinema sp. HArc-T2]|uniref:hypothetical protein n=1 Tax=Natrinema sp. HArc-T2 TaxID=3242701 RepID=UPI00359D0E71